MGAPREQELFDDVVEALRAELTRRGSPLASASGLDIGLEVQTRSILREVLALRAPCDVTDPDAGLASLLDHGRSSAMRDVDPSQPLLAAEVLFDVALPRVVSLLGASGTDQLHAAASLHRAIWRRFPTGAIAYVDELRLRLSEAEAEGRRAVSRELHDRIANGVAAARQRIELSELARDERARSRELRLSVEILDDVLLAVRDLAHDLRQAVGDRPLGDAIRELARDHEDGPAIEVTDAGAPRPIPDVAAEELFIIVMESVRNARAHAVGASQISVDLHWSDRDLEVRVRDDGAGSARRKGRPLSLGLVGIRERAQKIGAAVDIGPGVRSGFEVSVRLPFAHHRPDERGVGSGSA